MKHLLTTHHLLHTFLYACLLIFALFTHAHAASSHGLTLFGELKYPKNFTHFDYTNPDAPKGGTLKLHEMAAFDSLNPFLLKGVSAPGMSYVFESLMVPSEDEPQSYYGLIAKSIDIAADKSYADFVLRKQARWHDGVPVTAADIVFSYQTLTTQGHPAYKILLQPIEKVEALSPHLVRFTFRDPTNRENPIIAASLSILPKHYYENPATPFNKTTLTPPLGSGPYAISKVDQGRSIAFARAEDYWGADLPVNKGRYNFDIIHYDIYRDETVSVEAIKSGAYDFREEYIARNFATAYNIDAVEEGRLKKERIEHKISRGMQAFIFNTRKSKFADRRVREAISLTMDFKWMNRVLFYNAYARSRSFFQNTQFMAEGLPSEAEIALLKPFHNILPPALFTQTFSHPSTDGSGHMRAQLIKAQTLLKEAGWELNKDGIRQHTKTGELLTLEFMMRQKTFERVVGLMQHNLKRLGIASTFRYVDDSQYQKRIDSRDFDVVSIWWNRGVVFPGNEQLSYWHSSQANIAGGQNLAGVKEPVIDMLLEQLIAANTLQELTPAARALDRVLLWSYYVIPHWHLSAWRILYWDKFGRPDIHPAYGLGLTTWWVRDSE